MKELRDLLVRCQAHLEALASEMEEFSKRFDLAVKKDELRKEDEMFKCWLSVSTGLGDPHNDPYGEDRKGTLERTAKAFEIAKKISSDLHFVSDEDALIVARLDKASFLKALELMAAGGTEFDDIGKDTDPEEAYKEFKDGDLQPGASMGLIGGYDVWVFLRRESPGRGVKVGNLDEFKKAATQAGFLPKPV